MTAPASTVLPASEPEPGTGLLVGPKVDPTPARLPGPVVLTGRFGRIEKLDARHAPDLWAAVKDDDTLWSYMGYGPFADEAAFGKWISERAALSDPFAYAILDQGGRAVGISTLMEIRPANKVIEVGNILYSPLLKRTALATEAQFLLARYAFEDLGYRRYEWKCNALNGPSRRAANRYGFTFEGLFRQHMIMKGRTRDTAWFSITDAEWPERKAAFEEWLAAANFDAGGQQKQSLATLMKKHGFNDTKQ